MVTVLWIVSGIGLGNILVWVFFAGRLVQLVRDVEQRVGQLEARLNKWDGVERRRQVA
jgi:hypothetical protein